MRPVLTTPSPQLMQLDPKLHQQIHQVPQQKQAQPRHHSQARRSRKKLNSTSEDLTAKRTMNSMNERNSKG